MLLMHKQHREVALDVHNYAHLKQLPEKALRMLSTQNQFGLRSKY